MSRYLPVLTSTLLLIALGIGLGAIAAGQVDMPWWLAILLAGAAAWISDLAEQALRGWRYRRPRTAPRTQPARKAA
jgi:hypothetical protein